MSHRDRNENRARVDPNQLAKRTKVHKPKPVYRRPQGEVDAYIDALNEGWHNDSSS